MLANEQVNRNDDGIGVCERCESIVEAKQMEQWMFRTTAYADELLNFDETDYPEPIKLMQRNWIGRSEGADISFPLGREVNGRGSDHRVHDAPRHVVRMHVHGAGARAPAGRRADDGRMPRGRRGLHRAGASAETRSNASRRLARRRASSPGAYAKHPFSGEDIQIWIADYVLLSYGTGAVMGVPAHDERDFAFASERGIPIPVVIAPPDWDGNDLDEAYTGPGTMVNSGRFDGTDWQAGKLAVADALNEMGLGGRTVSYRLRDWLISRQRYWGAPIPMVYCESCGIGARSRAGAAHPAAR